MSALWSWLVHPQAGPIAWILGHESVVLWLIGASLATFLGTLVVVPLMIVRIPADYFSRQRRSRPRALPRHPIVRLLIVTARNILGLLFVLVGLAMLALPGQGLLTMLAGVSLMHFPGKFRLERWAVTRPPVLAAINWLRRKAGREALRVD